jgi:hypothetical protein
MPEIGPDQRWARAGATPKSSSACPGGARDVASDVHHPGHGLGQVRRTPEASTGNGTPARTSPRARSSPATDGQAASCRGPRSSHLHAHRARDEPAVFGGSWRGSGACLGALPGSADEGRGSGPLRARSPGLRIAGWRSGWYPMNRSAPRSARNLPAVVTAINTPEPGTWHRTPLLPARSAY